MALITCFAVNTIIIFTYFFSITHLGVEILNWSHNTLNALSYTTVLHPCPGVRGLLLQCYMAWTENSNQCTCRLCWKNKTKQNYKCFPSWALPALQNFHLKLTGNLEYRCLASCSAQGLGWGRPAEKGKKKNPFKMHLSWGDADSRDSISLSFFFFLIQQGNCPVRAPQNPHVARKYMEKAANNSTWR